jgi:hypothetical protein
MSLIPLSSLQVSHEWEIPNNHTVTTKSIFSCYLCGKPSFHQPASIGNNRWDLVFTNLDFIIKKLNTLILPMSPSSCQSQSDISTPLP